MAGRDYTWLQAKVARWLRRADLASDIPDFIMLAEKRISSDLEARLQNVAATLSTVAGVATVQIPDDLSNIRSLTIAGYGKIDFMTPEALEARYTNQSAGVPRHYAIEGGQIKLGPIPDAIYAMTCVYRAEIPALADAAGGVNWLITEHPEVYLAAALSEGFLAIRDTTSLQTWEGKYRTALDSLNKNDWNSAGTMAVRADARTP
ncbi:hypothetical protein AB595_04720 [Massilia sp. WF1]|uniref:phage adaptor protein n=1 Tax=unclassified Massilia TaxID=2609279 RepID=UPI00064A9B0D|nr:MULTISPECIES: hypothetical protein [unclassified Massilia]ALK96980.1 hypothetical protein AM586_12630 [Massilia sp. WG5]KLU37930.1 hypothetical protein AB595_04720 [Massilia sp. WF1]